MVCTLVAHFASRGLHGGGCFAHIRLHIDVHGSGDVGVPQKSLLCPFVWKKPREDDDESGRSLPAVLPDTPSCVSVTAAGRGYRACECDRPAWCVSSRGERPRLSGRPLPSSTRATHAAHARAPSLAACSSRFAGAGRSPASTPPEARGGCLPARG